ncbi:MULTISPECIES: acyl-CoA dehydrogenase family protein [Streptomyces]|uniref:Alkylation response protein AidB-like acyl-CoA dehydrogenase n=2 Tax=Streptomyces TaxID=1883 RepID=A0ABT9L8G2_STRGD|nr:MULTISPECIES: acyl-CoA dehydrogenase family protein [Streptomyces]MDP9679994.1 alkylation response protein AidB-like acyl-CoA dehydrogenase [Streptomyces griseoviridis]GGT04841.1 acyl-CoA dehydrogenase [Streptomyces griseoviridis]GGU56715.1 acyl-CoA dehydrogenase [Streptomyces daghestanicus]GHI29501.1 acyl-CoA dehydrogenase [Streptomyces daghestanicus]
MTTTPHPLVTRARRLADELLVPSASRVDQEGVPVSHIGAVRRSGLLGVSAPGEYGGAGAPDAVARETAEILAGACCSTWFVQTQHHTPVRLLARAERGLPVRERLLPALATGELLSGVAYAHVRGWPRVPVRVTPERGGWRFDGTVPWYTGWGLNDVLLLAGVTDDAEVVFAFTDAREQPGLRPSPPMRLAALTAARTVSLALDGLWVPGEAVVLRRDRAEFARTDIPRSANTSPAVFGVASAALDLLDGVPDARDTAAALRTRLDGLRRRAYALADHPVPHEHVEERLELRARSHDLLRAATTAAVVAGGGRAMDLGGTAQRLAREAMFLLVQGQTAPVRRAHLAALGT